MSNMAQKLRECGSGSNAPLVRFCHDAAGNGDHQTRLNNPSAGSRALTLRARQVLI
jgi:hypothetical protein